MMSTGNDRSSANRTIEASPLERTHFAEELERVLASADFRQSEQSKRLLRYLFEHSLEGNPEDLRERAIGLALFGLEPGYDTNENPIVRVRANEIRKRLAKYYLKVTESEIRLEVPSGGYRMVFHRQAGPNNGTAAPAGETTPLASSSARRRWLWVSCSLSLCIAAAVGAWGWETGQMRAAADPLTAFWGPALRGLTPVNLCAGNPVVYRYSSAYLARMKKVPQTHYQTLTELYAPPPDSSLAAGDVVAIPNQYIGLGSAEAIARLHAWFAVHHKDSDIRFGNDLTFSDLRRSPAVILGAYQNRWMLELTQGLRYRFDYSGTTPSLRDQQTGRSWSLPSLQDNGQTVEDYVLISRVLHSPSGEFVVAAAGITQYGGHTVAEVLTNPTTMGAALAGLAKNWSDQNLQLLFHVKVIGQTAGPPELIARHVW